MFLSHGDILKTETNSICYKLSPSWQQELGELTESTGGVLCSCSLDNKMPSATSQGIQTLTIFGVHSEAWHPGLIYASSQVSHTCPKTFVPPPLTPPPVWFLAWLASQLTNLLWPWCGLLGEMCGMQTRRLVLRMSLRSQQSQSPAVDKSPRVCRVQLCSVFQEQCQ